MAQEAKYSYLKVSNPPSFQHTKVISWALAFSRFTGIMVIALKCVVRCGCGIVHAYFRFMIAQEYLQMFMQQPQLWLELGSPIYHPEHLSITPLALSILQHLFQIGHPFRY